MVLVTAVRDYINKMLQDISGMKVLILDSNTVRIISLLNNYYVNYIMINSGFLFLNPSCCAICYFFLAIADLETYVYGD